MLEISNNSMSLARGCWKKYYWNYVEGLKPKRKASALTLGGIFHKAHELYFTGATDKEALDYIENAYNEELAKTFVDDQEYVLIDKYTAMGMWIGYPYKNLNQYQDMQVEKEFKCPVKGIRGVRFVGRCDGLVKMRDRWWVREIKTSGLTETQFKGRIKHSYQVSGYVYAANRLGFNIAGVTYDYIKKPRLRKGVRETVHDFGKRIMMSYIQDGKKPEDDRQYYGQPKTYRSDDEINMFLDDTRKLVKEMRAQFRSKDWTRNPDFCWSYNSECPYSKICFQTVPDKITIQAYYDKAVTNGKF